MKKGKAIFAILLVFVLGFLTGSIMVILTRQNGVKKFWVHHMAQSPITKEPISIELMEKIEDLLNYLPEDFSSYSNR